MEYSFDAEQDNEASCFSVIALIRRSFCSQVHTSIAMREHSKFTTCIVS